MEQAKIDRINALARIARERELTADEQEERAALRAEYVAAYRDSLRAQLQNVYVRTEDGKEAPLPKKQRSDRS